MRSLLNPNVRSEPQRKQMICEQPVDYHKLQAFPPRF